ncbi:MAG: hypothetical protein QM736_09495, partial [Vicinamibacterales bacterium]
MASIGGVDVVGSVPVIPDRAQPDCGHGAAGRSADAAAQRPELPRPGTPRSRCVADQHEQHAALSRNVGCGGAGDFRRQPAQPLEQLHRRLLSANDDAAGLSGIPYTVDAVEQFQVVTSGGQAELGRALGGYVNVVTKSGTNAAHGDAYGYFREVLFGFYRVSLLT